MLHSAQGVGRTKLHISLAVKEASRAFWIYSTGYCVDQRAARSSIVRLRPGKKIRCAIYVIYTLACSPALILFKVFDDSGGILDYSSGSNISCLVYKDRRSASKYG